MLTNNTEGEIQQNKNLKNKYCTVTGKWYQGHQSKRDLQREKIKGQQLFNSFYAY